MSSDRLSIGQLIYKKLYSVIRCPIEPKSLFKRGRVNVLKPDSIGAVFPLSDRSYTPHGSIIAKALKVIEEYAFHPLMGSLLQMNYF